MTTRLRRLLRTLVFATVLLSRLAGAQTNAPAGASPDAEAYRVSDFSIQSRWAGAIPVPLQKGDLWTPEKQSQVMTAIKAAFADEPSQNNLLKQSGEIGVFYVDVVEEKDEATRTVKLTFRPLKVNLSLTKLGDNVLPIPRSPLATRYQAVPTPLLAFNPNFGMTYDRAFGTAIGGSVQSDLLTLADTLKGRTVSPSDQHLDLSLNGARSFDTFYRAHAGLGYSWRRLEDDLQEVSFAADYDGTKEPIAAQTLTEHSGGAAAGATLRIAPHTRLTFNTGFRHAEEEIENVAAPNRITTEIQPNRLLSESLLPRPIGGFLRATIWEDNGWSDRGLGSHQRLATRIGYAREFAIAPNQTIGLELLTGAGKSWGNEPASRRFFGGNSSSQFLYDPVSSSDLVAMPTGPLIRSFGENQAVGGGGAGGGDGYWHVNLNLTFPIRSWSFPLIPQEDEIRRMLKNGINVSGRNLLVAYLKNQGLTPEEARAEASRTLDVIRPATEFIIEEANLYAIKPLLMFDAGGLSGAGRDAAWTAAGAGVQLTIVTARFELGYMHTLNGQTTGDRGNVFCRLFFQTLF
jgi:hypothetical protein